VAKNHKFSKSEAIKFGLNFFKANIGTFVKLGLTYLLISYVLGVISGFFTSPAFVLGLIATLFKHPVINIWIVIAGAFISILSQIIVLLVEIVVQIGLTKITLELYDGKPLNISKFYSLYPLAPRYLGATIIYILITMVGFILFIIPGIIWAIKFGFYSYLIVDKNAGLMDSLKKSSLLTQGVKMNLFIFGLLLILFNIAGVLALGIGLLVTIPTTLMASVYVYRKLLSQTLSVA